MLIILLSQLPLLSFKSKESIEPLMAIVMLIVEKGFSIHHSLKLGSPAFWRIAKNVLNKGESFIPPLFNKPEILSSVSDKGECFDENLSKNFNHVDSGTSLPFLSSKTNLKFLAIYVTLNWLKRS